MFLSESKPLGNLTTWSCKVLAAATVLLMA